MPSSDANLDNRRLQSLHGWTRLWNGDLDEAARILAPDFTVWFGGELIGPSGDTVRGPQGLADLIDAFRTERPGLVYSEVELKVHDETGIALWNASRGDLSVGGIDVFTFDGPLIVHASSVTGQRPHNA